MKQPDMFSEPLVEDSFDVETINRIWDCKKVQRPLPGMVVIERGPEQIREALAILDSRIDRKITTLYNSGEETDAAKACELDMVSAEIGHRVQIMIDKLEAVV